MVVSTAVGSKKERRKDYPDMRCAAAVAIALTCPLALGSITETVSADIGTVRVASGLNRPVGLAHAPGDESRLFIIEKPGRIKILDLDSGNVLGTDFLNITSLVNGGTSVNDERGLLGLAFHPDYDKNGYFYVHYYNTSNQMTLRRYTVSQGNPNVANASSGLTLLTIPQPFSNHNGGWIDFGPDGYLYLAMGDGGSGGDPQNNGQNPNNLLGTMLRLDVDNPQGGNNYGIPADNPFVGQSGRDEIWAYGLRNPWRNSFDRLTGDLYIADVGQNAWEEINFQPASSNGGENYGWRCYEGNSPFNLSGCPPESTLTFPIHVYPLSGGQCAITGGYVYRGQDVPQIDGLYFFGDYCSARIWSFEYDGSEVIGLSERTSELSPSTDGFSITRIASFGEDARGEIYIVSQPVGANDGAVYKIISTAPAVPINNTCDSAIVASDGSMSFSNEGATTTGPDEGKGGLCDQFGETDIEADVWFSYTATCSGDLTISLCGSSYATRLAVYPAECPTSPGTVIACNTTGCPTSTRSELTIPVTNGEAIRIRIGGRFGATGDGMLTITCEESEPLCPEDLNGDGVVNVSDLLILLGAWGPCADCDEDLNGDGVVNVSDLLILLGAWGSCN